MLKEAGVIIRLKKHYITSDSLDYIGHSIAPDKLMVARNTIETSAALRCPTTITRVTTFCGLCSVYRRFVPWFAKIATPLNRRLNDDKP